MEKFSRYYTPGVMLTALIIGLLTRNVELALTLLVIGCPGALVISIPVSIVAGIGRSARDGRSEEHTSELQSRPHLVCRLLLGKKTPPLAEAYLAASHWGSPGRNVSGAAANAAASAAVVTWKWAARTSPAPTSPTATRTSRGLI